MAAVTNSSNSVAWLRAEKVCFKQSRTGRSLGDWAYFLGVLHNETAKGYLDKDPCAQFIHKYLRILQQ